MLTRAAIAVATFSVPKVFCQTERGPLQHTLSTIACVYRIPYRVELVQDAIVYFSMPSAAEEQAITARTKKKNTQT